MVLKSYTAPNYFYNVKSRRRVHRLGQVGLDFPSRYSNPADKIIKPCVDKANWAVSTEQVLKR